MEVFQFNDYKECLRSFVAFNKAKRGYQSLLAEAAGCQRAFISQVLNSHVHLTPDHAIGLCQFWHLSELETDFFMELVALARAGTEAMRALSKRRLTSLRKHYANLGKKFSKASAQAATVHANYYSSWHYTAIHVLCSIPEFQTETAISEKLGIPRSKTVRILSELQEMGIISKASFGKWHPIKNDIFLGRDSAMTFTNHWNWRQKALEDIQMGNEDSIHYTSLHAMSRKDIIKFKFLLTEFISTTRELVAPSLEEDMVCITCDLFQF